MTKRMRLILLLSFLIFSCTKKESKQEEGEPKVSPVDSAVKHYFYYQPGTYWIYKDSLTQQIDSFFVTHVDSGVVGIRTASVNKYTDPFTAYNVHIDEYRIDSGKNQFVKNREMQLVSNMVFSDMVCPIPAYVYDDPLIKLPIVLEERPSFYGYYKTVDTFYQFLIDTQKFYHIVLITQHYGKDIFFVNTDAGILKMNIYNAEDSVHRIWELQRYNIVR